MINKHRPHGILHMCTYITCTTLMQIIEKHSNRVQPMDNASPLHMPHHTSPSPQYIGAHCQVNLHVKPKKKCTQVFCLKKRNTLAWSNPGEKASLLLLIEKEKLVMAYDALIQIFCANVSQPTMITLKKCKALK